MLRVEIHGVTAAGKSTIARIIEEALHSHGFDKTQIHGEDGKPRAEMHHHACVVALRNAETIIDIRMVQTKRGSTASPSAAIEHGLMERADLVVAVRGGVCRFIKDRYGKPRDGTIGDLIGALLPYPAPRPGDTFDDL